MASAQYYLDHYTGFEARRNAIQASGLSDSMKRQLIDAVALAGAYEEPDLVDPDSDDWRTVWL